MSQIARQYGSVLNFRIILTHLSQLYFIRGKAFNFFFQYFFFLIFVSSVSFASPSHSQWSKNALIGKINYSKHNDFVAVENIYTSKKNIFLHRDAYTAFKLMHQAAKKQGIDLRILSAARSFSYQKAIWERKWSSYNKNKLDISSSNRTKFKENTKENVKENFINRAREILQYSAMPNISRHHWGTEVDLNSLDNRYFNSSTGKKIYTWLVKHARHYGFCQVYSKKGNVRKHGFNEERWHWSYLPLAHSLLAQYNQKIHYKDIQGFSGSQVAKDLKVIEHYVNGINPACKPE